jgi:hypothetical protein
MRPFIFVVLLATLSATVSPATSSVTASSIKRSNAWRTFTSKRLGFSFRYPSTWTLSSGGVGPQAAGQVEVAHQGRSIYQLNALLLPIKAERTLPKTMKRFLAYEQATTQSTMFNHIRWASTTVGHSPALVGILRPSTEGGVAVSNAIFVTQSRTHAYEIMLTSNRSPAPTSISQFPSVYAQILATWRFI